jgi:hypothetical protein
MNINLGNNEIGVEAIQWLVRANWRNIQFLYLRKTNLNSDFNNLSEVELLKLILCESKEINELSVCIGSVNLDNDLLDEKGTSYLYEILGKKWSDCMRP